VVLQVIKSLAEALGRLLLETQFFRLQLGSRLPTCWPADHMIDQLASAESILSIHDRPHVERRRAT